MPINIYVVSMVSNRFVLLFKVSFFATSKMTLTLPATGVYMYKMNGWETIITVNYGDAIYLSYII